ncbi:phytanoyl-CoA dioxygenase family protein [Agromyces aurantiacus]|uniref:Phytanoyl-CoA dioxygenase family protein n=1 Tax=Agromyces aurantiacus TaxID=165814 RepID=A0ABV9R6T0_9MICO|nr:phytanoyl-CoA dioxygenase family protein [Agromyces aurantiacus]MBM7503861.1 ectoine hydroxylase-related dioxygenase (phytanoyl-CoA dioxygenase family) [Agromyces aurantiacus]
MTIAEPSALAATSAPAPAPAAAPANAPHHLTPEQVRFFDDHGYLVLRGRIPADLLARLQDAAEGWIADGRALAEDDPAAADYQWAARGGERRMFRVDYLHGKGRAASLELLGSPAVLGIAESLAGPDFVPTYESLVFKDEGDGAAIDWHQDAVHPRTHRILNVDVYLDASRAGEGALRVAPGSHLAPVDVCQLQEEFGWDAPGVIQVELEPGDVLVHDVMVVHGSEAVTGNRLRRTIYYEFRAAEQILAEGPWDAEWIDRRLRLLPVALREHARANPEAEPFAWNIDPALAPAVSDDDEAELRIAHLVHSPGSYCSAGSVPFTS